jgi:hypothetical protein
MSYTDIDDSSVHFQTAIWTGNGGSDRAIVNDGNSDMQPDWVWYKSRSHATSNILYDSSRGADYYLKSNTDGAEGSDANMFESFDSDGFSLNADSDGNASGRTYVGWQWKANGGTTTSVSASGTGSGCVNACTHQANTTAGFSIITYTGRDDQLNNGQESKLTHGLGVAPTFTIMKRRDATADWYVMGKNVTTSSAYSTNEYLSINDTDAINGNSYTGDTAPDATHIFLGNEFVNIASATYVCYAFAEKQGYSKFGKYVGGGSGVRPFIYTGFKPAWVMIRNTSQASNWEMFDHKRNPSNVANLKLGANLAVAENGSDLGNTSQNNIDILSNGFKLRTSSTDTNVSGNTYIYMAFAEHPFVTSTGVPATAR